jgi:ribosomal protein L11 methyltransferase
MNYIEVAITGGNVDSGEILAMMEDCEELGGWEKEGVFFLYWPENKWNEGTLESIKSALSVLGVADPESVVSVQSAPDQDWNAVWAASLTPVRIGKRFRIRQSWHSPDECFDGFEFIIDPKRAFGTGYHSTTQLVIEWLEQRIKGQERVLDIGTGSGILSMAAIRLGARSVLAIDNDPVAIECAQEYARINGFGPELQFEVSSFEAIASRDYDVVLANLDIRIMPQVCPYFPKYLKRAGVACLSGLLQQDLQEVTESLSAEGLQVKSQTSHDEWFALEVAR